MLFSSYYYALILSIPALKSHEKSHENLRGVNVLKEEGEAKAR